MIFGTPSRPQQPDVDQFSFFPDRVGRHPEPQSRPRPAERQLQRGPEQAFQGTKPSIETRGPNFPF